LASFTTETNENTNRKKVGRLCFYLKKMWNFGPAGRR
jgi:hypothetical protein